MKLELIECDRWHEHEARQARKKADGVPDLADWADKQVVAHNRFALACREAASEWRISPQSQEPPDTRTIKRWELLLIATILVVLAAALFVAFLHR